MKIEIHHTGETKIAEIKADESIINSDEDGLDLLGGLY